MSVIIEKDSFCLSLIAKKRLFTMLYEQVQESSFFDVKLLQELIDFADLYINFHQLSSEEVQRYYLDYIRTYNADVRRFETSNKYPLALNLQRAAPERIAYDIVLLFSTFMTVHRFRIMQLISEKSNTVDKGLLIGCGSGLEIQLIQQKIKEIVAYDLSFSPFLSSYFDDNVSLRTAFFDGSNEEKYDSIYLIELLEHLNNPFELLTNCKKVLSRTGKIFLTTATNIPQFDHLYNFETDHQYFDKTIKEMGLKIEYAEEIIHGYITKNIGSMNKFYLLSFK